MRQRSSVVSYTTQTYILTLVIILYFFCKTRFYIRKRYLIVSVLDLYKVLLINTLIGKH